MTKIVSRFFKEEDGATAIEYGLIAALISVAIAAVIGNVGTELENRFTDIEDTLSSAGGSGS